MTVMHTEELLATMHKFIMHIRSFGLSAAPNQPQWGHIVQKTRGNRIANVFNVSKARLPIQRLYVHVQS